MKLEARWVGDIPLEHACTSMGLVVALAGLLAMLASAFDWWPVDVMHETWLWLTLGLAAATHHIHRWIAPLFWSRQAMIASRHELPDAPVRA